MSVYVICLCFHRALAKQFQELIFTTIKSLRIKKNIVFSDYTFLIPDNFCSSLTNCIQLDTGYFCRLSLGSNSGGNFFDIGGLIDGDGLVDFGGLTNITGLLDLNRFPGTEF